MNNCIFCGTENEDTAQKLLTLPYKNCNIANKMKNTDNLLINALLCIFLLLFVSVSLRAQKVWTGTGFALNNGYLVTNWHVVDGAQTVHIYGIRGDFTKKYIADVVAKDKINDLAILKISGNGFPGFGAVPYKIRTTTAEVAEEIFALGFPMTDIMGDELKYTDGRISSLSGFDGDVSTYQISAPVQPGNSGGPLLDDNGNVIGIVCAKIDNRIAQNVNYAVKALYLKSLVETMQVTNVLPVNSQMVNYPRRQDKVKALRNFVFYIQCYDRKMPLDDVANRLSFINVSPTSLSFSEKQESKTLTISTNAPSWKVSSKPAWCTVTNKAATSVTINVTKNESYENRSGSIELETNDSKSASVYVSQLGKERPYITANHKNMDFDSNGGKKEISISTNSESWEVSSKPAWCTVTSKAATSVTINVSKNDSYESRNGVVELKTNDGKIGSVYVSQLGKEKPYIITTPSGINFRAMGGQKELSISTNSDSWEVSSKPDWCIITNQTATTVTISVMKYDAIRNGIIILETNDGITANVSVSQSNEWIDLGLPSGTLWKDKNEKDGFYTYDEAIGRFGANLPTKEQMDELNNYCKWTWTGNGYKVIGPRGEFIVIPAAGYRSCNGNESNVGFFGRYWSITSDGSGHAWILDFDSERVGMYNLSQCGGRSVRLVCNKEE